MGNAMVHAKRHLAGLAKLLLAFAVLGLVLYKADLAMVGKHLGEIGTAHLVLSFIFLNLSQIFSGLRMKYYFDAAGLRLNTAYAMALYYVGMFFNLVFPGGLGGDVYKIIALKKTTDFSYVTGIKLMLANRANGLLALIYMAGLLSYFIDFPSAAVPIHLLMPAFLIVTTVIYWGCARLLWNETRSMALGALCYSLAVQCFSVLSVAMLWMSLSGGEHFAEYMLLFLIAAIVGVLPISVGGLGIRELTFFYGAHFFNQIAGMPIDPELGVALSLSFFAVNVLASLIGIAWIQKVTKMHPYVMVEEEKPPPV